MKAKDKVKYNGKVYEVKEVSDGKVAIDTFGHGIMFQMVSMNDVELVEEYVEPVTIDMETWKAQQNEADANTCKPVTELKVGDYFWAYEFGLKNDAGFLHTIASDYEPHRTLCRVEKILTNKTIDEVNRGEFDFGDGCFGSICFDMDAAPSHQWIKQQLSTIYLDVTICFFEDGRHVFVNSGGYSYARNLLVSKDYKTMWANEIRAEQERKAEYDRQREAEFQASRAKEKADAEAYKAEVFPNFVAKKMPKQNVLAVLSTLLPDVGLKVTQSTYYRECYVEVKVHPDNYDIVKKAWNDFHDKTWYRTGKEEWFYPYDDVPYKAETSKSVFDCPFGRVEFSTSTTVAKQVEPKKRIAKTPKVTTSNDVQIIDYSERAVAVVGDTKPIKDELKRLGGRFNAKLSCGAGWIFSKKSESKLRAMLAR